MESRSPKSPEQTERDKQYDRQLRLWGDHGQIALESGHVCLIHATALGTETLKSLVLPGIGAITVIDENTVTEEDVGSNFFLETSSVGSNRAVEAVRVLLEMNPAVRGHSIQESTEQLLKEHPDFFNNFSVVIATSLSEKTIKVLSRHLWEANVPFILCRSIGFLGSLRVQANEHTIVETHPENDRPDLRLDAPFPELLEYIESFDMDEMEFKDHAHVPYVVVLYKAVMKWRRANIDCWPTGSKDKREIRDIIREGIRRDENDVPMDEENFEEAFRAVNNSLSPTSLPVNVKEVLYDSAAINLMQKSSAFWIMCSALRSFVESDGKGQLPLSGVIPDMTASTDYYINLQNIYKDKAARDAESVYRRVQQTVVELGAEGISESDVKLFCKHASTLTLVRGSCISQEYLSGSPTASYIARHLEEPDTMMVHYVLLRAAERFRVENCRFPGESECETDIAKLKTCVSKLLSEWSCGPLSKDDHVHEMCRYGGAEIHTVSAFMGGCVSHEAIKLITRQYKPVHNTFIYDATSSNTATFKF